MTSKQLKAEETVIKERVKGKTPRRYYEIDEGCTSCGACKTICPQHCISKGKPYRIIANKCIGCGLCVKRCWRGLIREKETQ